MSQAEHSDGPGIVQDHEILIRQVFLPDQLNSDGSIKSTALSKDDFSCVVDAQSPPRGFSMDRAAKVDPDYLARQEADFCGRVADRTGAVLFACSAQSLRTLEIEAVRSVCVVDRPIPENLAHAELWGAIPRSKALRRTIRDQVASRMRAVRSLDEAKAL